MRILTLIVGMATASVVLAAQQPAFEAVSVKPNASVSPAMNNRFSPGRMTLINHSPDVLIRQAYGVNGYQVINLSDWARNERFDIEATYSPPNAPYADLMRMLQTLLTDRFGLRVHRETRELTIYALVRVRPDGSLGPGLRASARDCAPRKDATGKPILDPQCSWEIRTDSVSGNVEWSALKLPLQIGILDRPVIDQTGLTGRFDITLQWLPDGSPDAGDRVSIFTALQEQLGLKLESTKGSVDVLVIDSISRPTPD